MELTRRSFIGAVAAAVVTPIPSFAAPIRQPFLEVGDHVDFLYFEDWIRPAQPNFGPAFVAAIGDWNGAAYEVSLQTFSYREGEQYFTGLDGEWCMFRKEVSDFSWGNPGMSGVYPNIHAYVREKRFGEYPAIMTAQMEHNRLYGGPSVYDRGRIPLRKTLWA